MGKLPVPQSRDSAEERNSAAVKASALSDRESRSSAPSADGLPPLAVSVLIALCAAKLLLHLFTSVRHYGYFRDELYYLDLARHLDWGYVDCAPLVAVYAKVALLMGGSLAARKE